MKIVIALLIIAVFVAACVGKGTKKDLCWRCDKDDCTGCQHWREMTGDGK